MIQGLGLLVSAVGAALLWGAVTGNSPGNEFLAALGIDLPAGSATDGPRAESSAPAGTVLDPNYGVLNPERDAPTPSTYTPGLPPHLRYP